MLHLVAEVRLHKLAKSHPGGIIALQPTSLCIPEGRITVIVGPSGCGKTTLLRLIAGLETPTAGSISFDGEPVDHLPPARRGVAMVTQEFALYPHLNVRRNMAFPLRMRRIAVIEIDRRVIEAASRLGIEHLLDRKPGSLSGGERQRAALGRVLVQSPRCALFDEPLSNLDAPLRAALRSELKSLLPTLGSTSVYVTHDREEAMALAEWLVVMADGAVQQEGDPGEVYRSPRNRFVAQFLGAPGVCFIEGSLIEVGENGAEFTDRQGFSLAVRHGGEPPASMLGRALTLGVRASDVEVVDAAQREGIAAQVVQIEPLGDRTLVHVEAPGGARLIAQARGDAGYRSGDSIRVRIAPDAIRLFEPGPFGRAIE